MAKAVVVKMLNILQICYVRVPTNQVALARGFECDVGQEV